jgi:hypothetical protein
MWWQIAVALAGGVGLGTILERIIEVAWIGRIQERRENKRWLREKRHGSFVRISQELLSLGLGEGKRKDIWDLLHMSAEVRMLIDDKVLADRIHKFIGELNSYDEYSRTDDSATEVAEVDGEPVTKGDMKIVALEKEAKQIVDELSKEILKS